MAGAQTTVVVTFSSRCGTTEALALAAAVGAVQGRALIRLRRLPDDGAPSGPGDTPECQDTLKRMRREYVPPTEADIAANDALVLAPPAGSSPGAGEWAAFVDVLVRLGAEGKLGGKVGAVVDAGDAETWRAFSAMLADVGFGGLLSDTPAAPAADLGQRATACGRRVAAAASPSR